MSAPPALRSALGAAALLGAACLDAWGRPLHGGDEAWFVQVVQRVISGDVLYRDVYFGVTPLAVQLTVPLCALWGAEAWLVRVLAAGSLTATAVLAASIARRAGAAPGSSPILAASILLFSFTVPDSLYSTLATFFLMAALWAVWWWDEAGAGRALALAGAACGACFATKQNVGLYSLAALLLVVWSHPAGVVWARVRWAAAVVIAFLVCAAVPLIPVWWKGAGPAFVDYAFLDKWSYLEQGRMSYLEGWRALAWQLTRHPLSFAAAYGAVYLFPPVALAGLGWMWHRGPARDRRRATVLGAFSVAAGSSLFPRADQTHLAYAAPVFLLAIVVVWSRADGGRTAGGGLAQAIVAPAVLGILLVHIVRPFVGLAWGTTRLSTLPHFSGVVMPAARLEEIRASAEHLREVSGGRVFVLSARASVLYLVGGLRNPTPFDYPIATAFGRDGQASLIAGIRAGRFPVCVDSSLLAGPQRPPLLGSFIERETVSSREAGPCLLHELKPGGSGR